MYTYVWTTPLSGLAMHVTGELAKYAGRAMIVIVSLAFLSAVMIMVGAVIGKIVEKWRVK